MTSAPKDLLDLRAAFFVTAGFTDPDDIGIVGDRAHEANGGYHVGKTGLIRISRYHGSPSQNVGSKTEDYSARLLRDRQGLTEDASAMDIDDDWPRGGRSAWLRFNALLVQQLRAGDPALASIRAVNYSTNGTVAGRTRVDRQNGFRPEGNGDNTEIHTHIEWYRDTAGRRSTCVQRLLEIAAAAIANKPLSAAVAQAAPIPGENMLIAQDSSGQFYVTDLIRSRKINAADVPHVASLIKQSGATLGTGATGTGDWGSYEGGSTGYVRFGWDPTRFGPVEGDGGTGEPQIPAGQSIDYDLLADKVADRLAQRLQS